MQSLVQIQAVQEGRDAYMLQYLLQKQGMLSMTGYKVLQGQEAAGLIPCYRVIYDTADKLNYDVEQYRDMQSILPELAPEYFLHYVRGILSVILNMRNIGFLHACNLETTPDKIFVDRADNSVHMVYLPISEAFSDHMNGQYLRTLKNGLIKAVQENKALQTEDIGPVFTLLTNASSTPEQILWALSEIKSLPQPLPCTPPTGTAALSQTGDLPTSANLSNGNLSLAVSELGLARAETAAAPEAALEPEPQKGRQKPRATKKGLFGKKAAPTLSEDLQQDVGGTEVLSMFVPCIYLKGQGKVEFLVDKQQFVLGRDSAADGTVDSTAISRRHCVVTHSDNRNFVTDLGSANGTYLNGGKLEPNNPRPINEGDRLKLGNIGFTVMNV